MYEKSILSEGRNIIHLKYYYPTLDENHLFVILR